MKRPYQRRLAAIKWNRRLEVLNTVLWVVAGFLGYALISFWAMSI